MAKVIPILKAGKDRENPGSYRPISLLSSLSKVYEKVLKKKLNLFIEEKHIFPDQQFGFRSHHSTSHQVLRICNIIKTNRTEGRSTGMVLLDIEKAFDSVWQNALIYKMETFGIPIYLIKVVQSFLSGRCFQVYVNKSTSVVFNIQYGVPQGSVLGPVLYNVYTSDFPQLPFCETGIYADDTCILSSHEFGLNIETNLQNALEILMRYYHKWKIKLNAGKIKSIFFTRKRKRLFVPGNELEVNGTSIKWESNVQYLGIDLDKRLIFNEHINKTVKKVNIAIKMLYPLINRKSHLSIENKIIIHKVVFQAILLYGCQVWGNCAICHIKKLQVCQNKILKMMFNLPWHYSTNDLHNQAGVELICRRIHKLTHNFLINCDISDNPLVVQLHI